MKRFRLITLVMAPVVCSIAMVTVTHAASFTDELNATPPLPPRVDHTFANSGVAVLDPREMEALRGGFKINGLDLAFGARLQSMIDDVLYQTVIEFTENGTKVLSHTLTDPLGKAREISSGSDNGLADVTSGHNIQLPGLSNFSGAVLNDSKGFTSVLHNVTSRAVVGSVVSNATERDISNHLDIDIDINNMDTLRNLSTQTKILNSLLR